MKSILNNFSKIARNHPFVIWTFCFLLVAIGLLLKTKIEIMVSIIGVALTILFIDKITYLGYLLILLIPLSIGVKLPGGINISLPGEGLILLLIVISILKMLNGLNLKIPYYKHPIAILLLMDLTWSLITTFTSEIPLVSIKRLVLKAIFITCFFYLIPSLMRLVNKYQNLLFLYGIGLLIPIISTTYNHYQLGLAQGNSIQVSLPFFDEHTIYAACITFVIPFFILQIIKFTKYRTLNILVLCFLLIGFILSYSRASWLSLGVAIVVFMLVHFKVPRWVLASSSIIIGSLIIMNFDTMLNKLENSSSKYNDDVSTHLVSVTNLKDDASNLERINRWVCAVRMAKDRPVQGFGPGTYQFVYDRFQTTQYMTRISTNSGDHGNAHSEYLMVLSESGFPGLLIFIGWVFSSYFFALKTYYSSTSKQDKLLLLSIIVGLTTFFIHGLFNSFIDSNKMAVLVYGSLGIIASMNHDAQLPKKV